MSSYPKDASDRQRMRAAARRELLKQAEAMATVYGRSINCGNWPAPVVPHHAGELGGCANDGSGCLCECHDRGSE